MADLQAVYDVNDYILNGTEVGDLLGQSNFTGIDPIFAIQDTPEAHELDGPYLVYTTRTTTDPAMWWITIDETNYTIRSDDFSKMSEIQNALFDIFKRMDLSATDIQEYLGTVNRGDFSFLTFRVINSIFPDAAAAEGGRMGLPFTIRYTYTINSGRDVE